MKYLLFISLFFISKVYSADLEVTVTGVDEYPVYNKVGDNKIFMTYNNTAQFVTNTSLFGIVTCSGTIEIIDSQQHQNVMCDFTDSYGNRGYTKSVPAIKKKLVGNMLGNRIGSSVGSWDWIGGEGPFAELEGTIMTGAYFAMGKNRYDQGNFIWKGEIEGVPQKVIDRINNYIPEKIE